MTTPKGQPAEALSAEIPDWVDRPPGFLSDDKISHDSEPFQYIAELHRWLWLFAEAADGKPASGDVRSAASLALRQVHATRAELAAAEKELARLRGEK